MKKQSKTPWHVEDTYLPISKDLEECLEQLPPGSGINSSYKNPLLQDGCRYQSCETPDYQETNACKLVDLIRHYAIEALPGYEEAKWI